MHKMKEKQCRGLQLSREALFLGISCRVIVYKISYTRVNETNGAGKNKIARLYFLDPNQA